MAVSDIEAELTATQVPWRTCATCHHLATMPPEEAASLRRMLANTGLQYKVIAKKLADDPESPTIPWETLARHARGECDAHEVLREAPRKS